MPEYTAASVAVLSRGFYSRCDRFSDSKVLMIPCKYFVALCTFVAEADEVFQDIKEAFLLEDPEVMGPALLVA